MMAAPRPPTGLPGSMGIHLPAFKRKRIEQWCDDVAQYIKAGNLCRSVIGHVLEDNRLSDGTTTTTSTLAPTVITVKSAPAGSKQRTGHNVVTSSVGTMADMLALNNGANKKDLNNGLANACFSVNKIDTSAPPPGRSTPMPDASGPLPVVKFSYSHYNEQRRRIDRLVQGLPVLTTTNNNNHNNNTGLDRLTGANGAVVFVNGDDPVRPLTLGSAASRERQGGGNKVLGGGRVSPGPAAAPRSNSRSSSGEPRQRPGVTAAQPCRHHSISPTPRHHLHNNPSSSQHHGLHQGPNNKLGSSEIVVIEDGIHGQNHHSSYSGLRSMNLNGVRRTQSQKVYKARQRMLANARKSGDHGNNHSQVPVQSCWALAELTW